MSKRSGTTIRSTARAAALNVNCGNCEWEFDPETGSWHQSVQCPNVIGHVCICPLPSIDPGALMVATSSTCFEQTTSSPPLVGEEQRPINEAGRLTNLHVTVAIADSAVPGGSMNFAIVAPRGREFVNVRTGDKRFHFMGNVGVVDRADFAPPLDAPDSRFHDFVTISYPQYDKAVGDWVWKTGYCSFNASTWYSQQYFTMTLAFPDGTKFFVELLTQIRQI